MAKHLREENMSAVDLREFMEIASKGAETLGVKTPGKEECKNLYQAYVQVQDFLEKNGDLEFKRNADGTLGVYFMPVQGCHMEPQ